ncbi:MAG: hypothetical protein H6724_15195 [Sandaracinus sp.]|nr:hypothetical protein [Sandaracinus sp.]MCB9623750.1 hypothetical protein [Sandaracinus sp.]
MKRALAVTLFFALACDRLESVDSIRSAADPECAQNENDAVRMRLAPTCAPCHGVGASRPFFASLVAFEDLLAYDARYVVRGDPDASPLVAMLEGRGEGAYPQMPLGVDSFADLDARGQTAMTLDEVRDWITNLPPPDPARGGPSADAATIRRLSADELINAIEVALGRDDPSAGVPPLLAVDGLPPLAPDSPTSVDYRDAERRQLYLMLGGPTYLQQRMPEPGFSPSSLLAVTQLAQGACASAVDANREVLFVHASRTATLPDAEAEIRANVAYLHERFLHVAPTEAEVDAWMNDVFVSAGTPRDGWVQLCTGLIRDPLFVTF